jgi:hypothetical protein
MLLRASSQATGTVVDIAAVNGEVSGNGGIAHAAELVAFAEAVAGSDNAALSRAREALRAVLTSDEFVDACAVIGAFNVVDRIADATGIPLDEPMAAMTGGLRDELDLARFRSSANRGASDSLPTSALEGSASDDRAPHGKRMPAAGVLLREMGPAALATSRAKVHGFREHVPPER